MKISFVIAVYHNEGAITKTYEQIRAIFASDLPDDEYEIVFVDDGSKDRSLAEMLQLHSQDPKVKCITFTRNFGQMAAMLAGFVQASGDAVINISADLQDPVELVPKMVAKWKEGSEIVICYRTERSDSMLSSLTSKIAYSILRLSLPQIPPGGFDFVLMDRKVMDTFNQIDVRHRFFQGDLLWTGYTTSFIPYARLERTIGKSQYNFWKRMKNFLDAILDVSFLPIRVISMTGFIVSLAGAFWGVTIVISWLMGGTPFAGWAPIMITILFIGGVIMQMLGVIGEYVWRINEEIRKRPNYIVRDKYL